MLTEERQAVIRFRLAEHGRVLAKALALEFRVSEDTVRR
ncbi:DeoR family transcriptional regulator, partial [Mesorhizobium sp. M1C.F.Ca.ET.212.01.1.1]